MVTSSSELTRDPWQYSIRIVDGDYWRREERRQAMDVNSPAASGSVAPLWRVVC